MAMSEVKSFTGTKINKSNEQEFHIVSKREFMSRYFCLLDEPEERGVTDGVFSKSANLRN